MSDPMQDIRASFFVECDELLEALQDGLQSLESGTDDGEAVNVVFRAVHSIKGGAGAFGLDDVVSFSHAFETSLDHLRAGRIAADGAVLALFFQCADALSDLVHAARDGLETDREKLGQLGTALSDLAGADAETEEPAPDDFVPLALDLDLGLPAVNSYRIRFRPDIELYRSGNEPLHILTALADLGKLDVSCEPASPLPGLSDHTLPAALLAWDMTLETETGEQAIREIFEFSEGLCLLEIEQMQTGTKTDSLPPSSSESGAQTASPPVSGTSSGPPPTVRVELARVERLVNLVGELVINQAMLAQSLTAAGIAPETKIAAGLDEFQRLTRDIQEGVMKIRAQPVKPLFQRMARIARESSAAVGKTVRFRTEGEATEIDKTVIERLADPLTHMIRNAVDHGLETTEARIAAGKPAEGTVTLSAMHRSGRVVIEVSDDGGGIDRGKVRRTAEEKGLIDPSTELTEAETDSLLFLPGFSTAQEVSNLSGRGVGMDVVKNAITALGGRITITSLSGAGTTFSTSLPLTLAVLDGMVVQVGQETLVLPLSVISETLALKAGDIRTLGPETRVVNVRGSFLPLVDLAAELGFAPLRTDFDDTTVVVVAQEDGSRAALVVDEIEDQRQVVIKGLSESYGRVPGIAAATILGDGQIALILDAADVLANTRGRKRPTLDQALAV